MKRKSILDSSALLRFFQKESGAEIVKNKLEKAQQENQPLLLNLINLGEIYYIVKKKFGEEKLKETLILLEELPISWYPISKDLIIKAADLKADYDLPFVDAICAATALMEDGDLLTSDPHFKKVEKEISIIWIL